MGKILQVLSKNFKVLLRNKFSLTTMILGPIIIILMLGFLFNNQGSYNLNVGLYTPEQTPLYSSYLDSLKADGFKVITYDSSQDCREGIRRGINNVCIIFPDNFVLKDNHVNKLEIKIDPSKKNIRFITQNLILSSLNSQSRIYQIDNTKGLADALSTSEVEAYEISESNSELFVILSKLRYNTDSIDKRLVELRSSFNINGVDFESLEQKSQALNEYVLGFVNSSRLITDQMSSNIDNISALADEENSTISDEIKSNAADIKRDITSLNSKLNSIKYNYNLNSLKSDILEASSQFGSLEDNIGSLNDNIDSLAEQNSELLNTGDSEIIEINSSLNAIFSSISDVKITDVDSIVKPVQASIEPEGISKGTHLSTLIPNLIVGLISIIAIILSSNFILMEKENASYFRNFLTKNSSFNFFISNFIALSTIIFFQITLIILIYYLLFLKYLGLNMLYFIMGIIPIIAVFVLLGMIIGHISNNQATNIILSFLVIFIFFALSGSILPLELLPTAIKNLVINNPYVISESIIRKFIIFGMGLEDILYDILYLFIYIIFFFVLNIFFESIDKKRAIYQYYVALELRIKNKLIERKSNR